VSGEQQAPPPAQEPAAPTCANCGNGLTGRQGHYEVKHIRADGSTAPKAIRVCSILCLIRWAYNYMVRRGVQGVAMAKQMFDNLKGQQG
jgi:hypothetical protein